MGPKDLLGTAFLLAAGGLYFSLYYDYGFNFADEGSVVLTTARLVAGERPFVDIAQGYGLLWFYPLVLLSKAVGVNFIAVRIYFLSVALTTSLLAYLTVRRHSDCGTLSAVVALAVLAVPGTLHKAYIPLIVVANMLCFPSLNRRRCGREWSHVFGAALVASISYHLRPELGFCAALVLATMLVAETLSLFRGWTQRVKRLARLSVPLAVAGLVPTVPLAIVATRHGFLAPFLAHLASPLELVGHLAGIVQGGSLVSGVAGIPPDAGKLLSRAPLAALWEVGGDRNLGALTHAPLLSFALIATMVIFEMVRRKRQSRPVVADETFGMLGLMWLAGSAFPQFFLYRPDFSHLSQFMPGYMVLVGVFLARWLGRPGAELDPEEPRKRLLGRALTATFLVLHLAGYTWAGVGEGGAGSIALTNGRTERFVGANGVRVWVTPAEQRLLTTVIRVVEENTEAEDEVVCFPYCPGFIVITNRRSSARRLYVDDALLVLEPNWQQGEIARIRDERPPLIIIHDWAINRTEISRFPNWATQMMEYIESEYVVVESSGRVVFYVRQDRSGGGGDGPHANPRIEL